MLAHPSTGESVDPAHAAAPRVAVLVNARARKVNARVVRALSHVVPRADLYVSPRSA